MSQFELAFLGTPRIRADGQTVKFATRKAQALLIFLAVEAVPVARDKLIDLLWVDSDLARGQVSLRTTLAQVRRGLGQRERVTDATATPAMPAVSPLLLAETGTLAINPEADCRVDVHLLDQAYALSRSFKLSTVSSREVRSILEQAAATYAGDFLDGFSPGDSPNFDDWVSVQRQKWHARFSAVLDRLSQLQFEGGQFAAGIETANRWITHDALNEIAHRRLMQLHLATGNRAGALAAYEACQAILARELNADPSPETEALAGVLRTQDLPTIHVEAIPETDRPRVPATALVGRAEEHRQLVQAYRLARDGQGQAVVIQGEPGIGKTRLAQEFLGWVAAQGAVVIQAAAYELTGNLPYQVWTDAFRAQLSQTQGRAALATLDRRWHTLLAHLLPELDPASVATDDSTEIDAKQSRHQLFEAAFRFVQQLIQTATTTTQHTTAPPHVVFLDDVQWADAASLDLLQYLAHRCAEEIVPMMLVMTLREEAANEFEASLTLLRRHMQVKQVLLSTLSQADSQQVVQALVAQALKNDTRAGVGDIRQIERFAQRLFDETAGHPLYLIETFKSLFEDAVANEDERTAATELTRWQAALEGWLAPGVKAVISARLKRLTPQAMTLVNAVAVLGQRNAFEDCRLVANLDEDDALNLLDESLRRGLLRESAGGAVMFTHDKIREVVYADLSASRRRSLHRRAAEMLARLYPDRVDDNAALIARHFDASDDPRALSYFQRAGHAATKVYAYREAAAHFARAIALAVAQEPNLEANDHRAEVRRSIADLHFKQYSMHVQLGEFGVSIQTMRRLAELARQWDDPVLEQVTRVWIAPNLALPGPHMQLDEAERLAEHILSHARATNAPIDEVHALRTSMRVALWRAQFDLALRYGQTILEGSDVQSDGVLHGYVLSDLVWIESFRHNFDAAQRYQAEALTLWRTLDRPALIVMNLSQAGFIAMCRGDFPLALSLTREVMSISQRTNNDWPTRLSHVRTGPAYFELGQADRAIEVMQEARRLSHMTQQDVTYILASADLARIYGRAGRVSEGLAVAQAAYDVAGLRVCEWQPYVVPVLVELHVRQHQLPQAEAWLAQGRASLHAEYSWPAVQISLDAAEAELALAHDDAARALALSTACIETCRQQCWRQQLPLMELLQARALRASGEPDEALRVLKEASDEATATHAQWSLEQIVNETRSVEATTVLG